MKLEIVAEKYMSIINLDKLVILFCIFPAWIFLPDISFYDKLLYASFFLLLIVIVSGV